MTSKQLDPSSGHNAVSSKMQSNQDHNDKHVSTFHFTQLQAEEGLHFPIQSRLVNDKRTSIFPFHQTPSRRRATFSNPIKTNQQVHLNISISSNSKLKKGYIFQSNQDQWTTSASQYFHFTQLQAEEGIHFSSRNPPNSLCTMRTEQRRENLTTHKHLSYSLNLECTQTPNSKTYKHLQGLWETRVPTLHPTALAVTMRNQGTPPPNSNPPETKSTHNNSANIGIVYLLIHVESVRGLIKERHIVLEVSDVDCDCGHSSPSGASCSSISGQDRESVGRPHFIVERSTTGDLTGLRIDLEAGRQTRNDNILLMCTMIKAKQTSKQTKKCATLYIFEYVCVCWGWCGGRRRRMCISVHVCVCMSMCVCVSVCVQSVCVCVCVYHGCSTGLKSGALAAHWLSYF